MANDDPESIKKANEELQDEWDGVRRAAELQKEKAAAELRQLIEEAFPEGVAHVGQLIKLGFQPSSAPTSDFPQVNEQALQELTRAGGGHIDLGLLLESGVQVRGIPKNGVPPLPGTGLNREHAEKIFGKNFFGISTLLLMGVWLRPEERLENFSIDTLSKKRTSANFTLFYGHWPLTIRYFLDRFPHLFADMGFGSSSILTSNVTTYTNVTDGWNALEIPNAYGNKGGTFKEQYTRHVKGFRNYGWGYEAAEAVDVVFVMVAKLVTRNELLFPPNIWIRTKTLTSYSSKREGVCVRMGLDKKIELKLVPFNEKVGSNFQVIRKRDMGNIR